MIYKAYMMIPPDKRKRRHRRYIAREFRKLIKRMEETNKAVWVVEREYMPEEIYINFVGVGEE